MTLPSSDSDYLALVIARIDAVIQAATDVLAAEDEDPRRMETWRSTYAVLCERGNEAIAVVVPRLVDILTRIGTPDPQSWGVLLISEIRGVMSPMAHRRPLGALMDRYHALLPIEQYLRNGSGVERRANDPELAVPPIGDVRPKVSLNARVLAKLQEDPTSVHWSARQWAESLEVVKSTIIESPAWGTIQSARAIQAAGSGRQRPGSQGRRRRRDKMGPAGPIKDREDEFDS